MAVLQSAEVPTFYFIGVTTRQSSIMKVFPKWAEALGLQAEMKGIDLPLHTPHEEYCAVTDFKAGSPVSGRSSYYS